MKRPFQQSRLAVPGRTLVRNTSTGIPMMCCWDDCTRDGYDEIKIIVREPQKNLHYIFCSERHKRLYTTAHREYGKLGA